MDECEVQVAAFHRYVADRCGVIPKTAVAEGRIFTTVELPRDWDAGDVETTRLRLCELCHRTVSAELCRNGCVFTCMLH